MSSDNDKSISEVVQNDLGVDFIHPYQDDVKHIDFRDVFDRGAELFDEPTDVLQDLFELRMFISQMHFKYSQKHEEARTKRRHFEAEKRALYNKKNDENPLYEDDARITNDSVDAHIEQQEKWKNLRNEEKRYGNYRSLIQDLSYMMVSYLKFLKMLMSREDLGRTTLKMLGEELKEGLKDTEEFDELKRQAEDMMGSFTE